MFTSCEEIIPGWEGTISATIDWIRSVSVRQWVKRRSSENRKWVLRTEPRFIGVSSTNKVSQKRDESVRDCSRTRAQINVIRLRKFECKWERGIKINYLILKL